MATWGDGLRWDAAALRASAEAQSAQASTLGASLQRIADSPTGVWEGAAAAAAMTRRRALVAQAAELAGGMADSSAAYADAASRLLPLRADMDAIAGDAASRSFLVTNAGHVEDRATGWQQMDPRRGWWRIRIWSSVQALAFRLTALDVAFAGRLAVLAVRGLVSDWARRAADGLLAGAQFVGDRIDDGMDWAKDRWEDLGDLASDVRETIGEHLGAFGTGAKRFLDAAGERPRWLDDLLRHGELPEVAEVLAAGGYLAGLGAGAVGNLVKGRDLKFFDDGTPFVGDSRHEASLDARRLSDPSDLMRDMWDVYATRDQPGAQRPSVQVTMITNPGEPPRYVVAIPGTTESMTTLDGWTGHPAGTDWAANLKGVGYGTTSSTEAIMEAIDQVTANHPGGGRPEIVLTGHSQGGIIAANLAADPGFSSRYEIGGIMTAGSPIQTIPIPRNVPVINFNNQYDPVPKVDLGGAGGSRTQGNVVDVPLRNGPGERGLFDWHGQETYDAKIRDVMRPGQSRWVGNEEPVHDFSATIDRFYAHDGASISTYRVEVGREE